MRPGKNAVRIIVRAGAVVKNELSWRVRDSRLRQRPVKFRKECIATAPNQLSWSR
jgi:hypothetical protein